MKKVEKGFLNIYMRKDLIDWIKSKALKDERSISSFVSIKMQKLKDEEDRLNSDIDFGYDNE